MPNQLEGIIAVQFQVNGREIREQVPADMNLMHYLRERLGFTGVKDGCDSGHCGACTVIIDGKAQRACLVKISKVIGKNVETIEGLSRNGLLHPVQRAFIEKGAVQCGFCTPGMIMVTKALLDHNPNPTLEQVKQVLTQNRNICRCTGYVKIFEAVQQAAAWLQEDKEGSENRIPSAFERGNSLRDDVAIRMVTGENKFAADLEMEDMLHGKVLWAAYPSARIRQIITDEAEATPGVVAVITARDIPGLNQAGMVIRDQVAIASDRVHYIGDAVASVFAETPEIADMALGKIKVDYEPLPGVFSPQEAAAAGASLVHPEHPQGNLLHHAEIVRGDVDKAFEECSVIVAQSYFTPFIEHGFLEPEAGLAFLDEDGTVVVKVPTQSAFDDRTQLSEILDMHPEKIRVVALPCGGAFGGKEDIILQQHLALGALKTRRPVKMVLSREESLRVHVKRHPAWMSYKTGASQDGKVLAIQAEITLDTGAYASLGIDVLENTIVFGAGPYYVPNLKLTGKSWYTNNVLAGAMRGFGVNQVAFALEQQMDAMARALGMDPFEFRLINALDVGLPSAADHIMEEGVVSIKQTIEAARRAYQKSKSYSANGKKIGIGVASAVKNIGFGHEIPEDAGAVVELDSNGCVQVRASQHEYGQGAIMGLIKLASLELGVDPEIVEVTLPDTAYTPVTGSTTASRQTVVSGNAVVMACRALKEELFARAADHLGIEPRLLRLRGDKIVDPTSGKSLELKELGKRFTFERRFYSPHTDVMLPVGERSHIGQPDFRSRVTHFCYAYNTQVAIIEADPATGEVKVLKIISANDVGKILNRDAIEGQIHGGVMMGLGFALSEQFLVDNGVNLTDTLRKCGLPTASMTPEIESVIVEVPHPDGPLGVKGFAEAPSLATAPAIMNAIYDALGVRVTDLPADRKRVLQAIKESSELEYIRKP